MSAWLRITLEVELECADDTTQDQAAGYVDGTVRSIQYAVPNAVDVSVADWSLDR